MFSLSACPPDDFPSTSAFSSGGLATSSSPASATSTAMRLCYNGATTLLAATACPAFVDLDSIREEPPVSPRHFDRDDSVFFGGTTAPPSAFSSTFGSPTDEQPSSSHSSPFKLLESIQRKRKSMFRRNQSSSSLVSEKRRTCRRPSLPSIPPTIDEMSSSVGHARSRRPSLHNDWTNEHHHRERSAIGMVDVS
ncbi:unnamed protein product [Caenorhabditis sp. 36 PRJEB53466]|nr:unnamed protein product [Caenorhabditis sp. 36 PRJEB53466]